MGSRINRVVGWGGMHPDRDWLSDRLFEHAVADEVEAAMARADAFAKAEGRDCDRCGLLGDRVRFGEDYPAMLKDLVVYAENIERRDGLWVIAPPGTRGRWHRRDDDIDYHAIRWNGDAALVTEVRWLPEPLYPYGPWCWENAATGMRVLNRSGEPLDENGNSLSQVPPPAVQAIAVDLRFPDWRLLKPVLVTWWD